MDLVETTLKIVENEWATRENLLVCVQNFKEYENYIDETKDHLQQTQLLCSSNKKILELNNFVKTALNENSKMCKELFGKVYSYKQQVAEKLCTILDQESSLEHLYQQNEKHCILSESKYNSAIKILEILEQDSHDQLLKKSSKIEHEIKEIDEEHKTIDEFWKISIDEYEEKHKMLESLAMDVSILYDELDLLVSEQNSNLRAMQQKIIDSQRTFTQANIEIDVIKDRIVEKEEEIITTSKDLNQHLIMKEENERNHSSLQIVLDQTIADCVDIETAIKRIEEETVQVIDNLMHEIESKSQELNEKENELRAYKNKEDGIANEVDQIGFKIKALNEEFADLKNEDEKRREIEQSILNAITTSVKESENLEQEIENCISSIEQHKNNLRNKELNFEQIKCAYTFELSELREGDKHLEAEQLKNMVIERETEAVDTHNKELQQTIETLELQLRDLDSKNISLKKENHESQTRLRNVEIQCDNFKSEIKRLEATREQQSKLIPAPPLKRMRSSTKQSARTRGLGHFDSSDDSIDGEKLTHSQYMKKIKMF